MVIMDGSKARSGIGSGRDAVEPEEVKTSPPGRPQKRLKASTPMTRALRMEMYMLVVEHF